MTKIWLLLSLIRLSIKDLPKKPVPPKITNLSGFLILSINNIFIDEYNSQNAKLGQVINISKITASILGLPGVNSLKTRRVSADGTVEREVPFLNIFSFNTIYSDVDLFSTSSNITLQDFKYPFLYNSTILNKIIIETVS